MVPRKAFFCAWLTVIRWHLFWAQCVVIRFEIDPVVLLLLGVMLSINRAEGLQMYAWMLFLLSRVQRKFSLKLGSEIFFSRLKVSLVALSHVQDRLGKTPLSLIIR